MALHKQGRVVWVSGSRWVPIANDSPAERHETWTLFAGGDFCVQQSPKNTAFLRETKSFLGTKLRRVIRESDLAMVNLEGPLAGAGAPSPKAGPNFRIDPEFLDQLAKAGIGLMTLANSHIMDYGQEGLAHTIAICEHKGLRICGAGMNRAAASQPAYITVGPGARVAVFDACENEFGIAEDHSAGAAGLSDPDLETKIVAARKDADVVIVAAHGGCEEVPFPPVQRRAHLRRLIDAGADLVIGHHPHVPQGWERWGKGLIFYSLGDFFFRWPDGSVKPLRRWGIVIVAHFDGARLEGVEVVPIETRSDGTVDLVESPDLSERRLKYLDGLSAITSGDELPAYWQVTARRLWQERYWPCLQASTSPAQCHSVKFLVRRLFHEVLRRAKRCISMTGDTNPAESDEMSQANQLVLLHLLRNESHRWAMETWLSVASGDQENLISGAEQEANKHWRLMHDLQMPIQT